VFVLGIAHRKPGPRTCVIASFARFPSD
jgi:hypothetical protein